MYAVTFTIVNEEMHDMEHAFHIVVQRKALVQRNAFHSPCLPPLRRVLSRRTSCRYGCDRLGELFGVNA